MKKFPDSGHCYLETELCSKISLLVDGSEYQRLLYVLLLSPALKSGCRGAADLLCTLCSGRCFPFPTSHMVLSLRHYVVYILTEELYCTPSTQFTLLLEG